MPRARKLGGGGVWVPYARRRTFAVPPYRRTDDPDRKVPICARREASSMSSSTHDIIRQSGTSPGGLVRAWHRVRWMAAVLIPLLFAFYVPPEGEQLPFPRPTATLVFLALIVAGNLVSIGLSRADALTTGRLGLLLVWDAGIVLGLQALFAFDEGLSLWVLAVFPIMGGALLRELPGALGVWLFMLTGTTVIRAGASTETAREFWSSQLFRGSMLLLIAVFVGSLVREVAHLIAALRSAEATMRQQSARDDLTGIANRSTVHRQLAEAVGRAQRGAPPPSLLYIDVDDFKTVNDRLGHGVGDRALQVVAERMTETTRTGDVPARLGGDEFCVLLQSPDSLAGAGQLAQRLRERINEPWEADGNVVRLSVSIGVANWTPDMTATDLLHRSDRAMYVEKTRSRELVTIEPIRSPSDAAG